MKQHREAHHTHKIQSYGPPGTGKTLLCSAAAAAAHANFISVDIADLLRSEYGESEKRLAEVFRQAREASPSILFFDEIQSIFSSRETAGNNTRSMVSQLLLELDQLQCDTGASSDTRVTVIAATNVPQVIDPGFFQAGRFGKVIFVPPPDRYERREVWEIFLKYIPLAKDMGKEADQGQRENMEKQQRTQALSTDKLTSLVLKSEGFTGADIMNACRKAGLVALANKRKHTNFGDFVSALDQMSPSVTPDMMRSLQEWRQRTFS